MDRGQTAEKPKDIPKKGWKAVLLRVKDEFGKDHLDIISAGVGFYFFLALFPLLAAMVSIYGLVFDPAQVEQHMSQLTTVLPQQASDIIGNRLRNVAEGSGGSQGLALAVSILLSLWSANLGTKALFQGINIAYNQENNRSFIKFSAITLAVTLGGIIIGLICAALIIAFPALVGNLGLPDTVGTVISWARWPVLFGVAIFAIAMLYKIAPDRDNPKFRWVSWGSATATLLWIVASVLFSVYVNNFGNYDATYGSVAAVIILMLWFQITALCILLGAEINSELEHQTAKDTTVGEEKPIGERDAYFADRVASGSESEEEPENKAGERGRDRDIESEIDGDRDTERDRDKTRFEKDRGPAAKERYNRNKNKNRHPDNR